MKYQIPVLQGLSFTIRITPLLGYAVLGVLEEEGEIVFEAEFPSYTDAYWKLMEIDQNDFLSRQA